MNRKLLLAIVVVLCIGVTTVAAYFAWQQWGAVAMIEVHLLDRNHQEIGTMSMVGNRLAIIGDYEGVYYIYFTITIKNTGDFPLTMSIIEATPTEFASALATSPAFTINPGQQNSWVSGEIDVAPFVGTTTRFTIKTQGLYTYAGEQYTMEKEGWVDITVQPDPVAGYDVIIESSTGQTGGGAETTTVPTTIPGTTTTVEPCWTAGTTCDPADHNCCNTCVGTTVETKEDISASITSTAQFVQLSCPSTYNYCELYKDGNLQATCNPGQTCTGSPSIGPVWTAKGVTTETVYACT